MNEYVKNFMEALKTVCELGEDIYKMFDDPEFAEFYNDEGTDENLCRQFAIIEEFYKTADGTYKDLEWYENHK